MRRHAKAFAVLAAATLFAGAFCACRKPLPASETPPAIDGREAYFQTKGATEFGPRIPGSVNSLRTIEWLSAEARVAGAAKVQTLEFYENTPEGRIKFRNLVVDVKGASDRFIIVGAHYDTKKLASCPDFIGANDGASGTGMALQMLKAICVQKAVPPHSLKFVFFDGEECFIQYSKTDGLYGSRRLARDWNASGLLKKCDAIVILDMIGDADLKVTFPADSDAELSKLALDIAGEKGLASSFGMYQSAMLDDHSPFQELGVPALDFIDFDYGPENRYWHTSADTMDKVAGESFTKVGTVAMELLWRIPVR